MLYLHESLFFFSSSLNLAWFFHKVRAQDTPATLHMHKMRQMKIHFVCFVGGLFE